MAKAVAEYRRLRALVERQAALLAAAAPTISDAGLAATVAEHVAATGDASRWEAADAMASRPKVGTAALITCSLYPGRILIGERRGSHGAGRWAVPGGHLEGGEEWGVCLSREILEETGLALDAPRFGFVAVTNDIMPDDGLHYITLFLHVHIAAAEAARVVNAEPDKCTGWHWLTWEELRLKSLFMPMQNFMREGGPARLQAIVGAGAGDDSSGGGGGGGAAAPAHA